MVDMRTASVGERLARLRGILGVSTRELGQVAGVSKSAIHAVEHGRIADPGVSVVGLLARALGVSRAFLAYGDGDPPDEESLKRRWARRQNKAKAHEAA